MTDTIWVQIISTIGSILLLFVGWILNNRTKKYEKQKKDEIPVIQSEFFSNAQMFLRDCDNLEIEHINEGRLLLVKDYYKNKVTSFIEPAKIFAERVDACCATCKKDCSNCNQILNYANEMFLSGLEYEKTCMQLVMSPEDMPTMLVFNPKFIQWHQPHVDRFEDRIKSVVYSPIFKECNAKAHLILIELDSALRSALSELTIVAITMNGELTGKSWKGKVL